MKKCRYCGIEFEGAYSFCSDFCRDNYLVSHRNDQIGESRGYSKKAPYSNYDEIAELTVAGGRKGKSYGQLIAEKYF